MSNKIKTPRLSFVLNILAIIVLVILVGILIKHVFDFRTTIANAVAQYGQAIPFSQQIDYFFGQLFFANFVNPFVTFGGIAVIMYGISAVYKKLVEATSYDVEYTDLPELDEVEISEFFTDEDDTDDAGDEGEAEEAAEDKAETTQDDTPAEAE